MRRRSTPTYGRSEERTLRIREHKDFWSGVMFVAFAGVMILEAGNYSLGTAAKMGPAYFPVTLGLVLAGIGAVLMLRSFVLAPAQVEALQLRPILILVASVVLFGFVIETLGLLLSLALVTGMSAIASRESRPLEAALLAAVLTALSFVIFIVALRLPLPV